MPQKARRIMNSINENVSINENENIIEDNGFSTALYDDITKGLHSVLFKRIGNVSINDVRMQDAFRKFTNDVELGESFSIAEMLISAEKLVVGGEPDVNAGNGIYYIDNFGDVNKRLLKKLLRNSVEGIYMLFALRNGISLDIDLVGGSIYSAETKRFLVVSPDKFRKLSSAMKKQKVECIKVGEMISSESIILSRGDEIVANVDKKSINDENENVSVTIDVNDFPSFLSGYNAVFSMSLCDTVSANNVIRFGIDGGIQSVFARALGAYTAVVYDKNLPMRHIFTSEKNCSVAVSRPNVSDGDYLYLLRVRYDVFGMPDKSHFSQLKFYLTEKKNNGIIKDILPVRDNIERIFKRLSNKTLEYIPISENIEYGFGVVVTVGRGESVNGLKIGYFKSIPVNQNGEEGENV